MSGLVAARMVFLFAMMTKLAFGARTSRVNLAHQIHKESQNSSSLDAESKGGVCKSIFKICYELTRELPEYKCLLNKTCGASEQKHPCYVLPNEGTVVRDRGRGVTYSALNQDPYYMGDLEAKDCCSICPDGITPTFGTHVQKVGYGCFPVHYGWKGFDVKRVKNEKCDKAEKDGSLVWPKPIREIEMA